MGRRLYIWLAWLWFFFIIMYFYNLFGQHNGTARPLYQSHTPYIPLHGVPFSLPS